MRPLQVLQQTNMAMQSMEGRTGMMPGTHIETSPVSRMNVLLDERMLIDETDVMNRCEFCEKFINELAPYLTYEEEQECRDFLAEAKREAWSAMSGKKTRFNVFCTGLESELRRKKNDLENRKVIR